MTARVLVLATLVVALFAGCTDQSQLTGPMAKQGGSISSLDKAKSEFVIKTVVSSASGTKYSIEGSVNYSYIYDPESATARFWTDASLGVTESGTEIFNEVRGGQSLDIVLNPAVSTFVSDMLTINGSAETAQGVHIIQIQYELVEDGVKLVDVTVLDGDSNR